MPDPALPFRGVERIQVDEDLPGRLAFAVLGRRRAAPDAARVLAVAPEVVVMAAELFDVRDALVGIEDRKQIVAQRREARVGLERLLRARVLLPRPVEGRVTGDVLEPQVGIGLGGGSALDVAKLAAGVAPPRGPAYYALLVVGLVATVVATTAVTRAARRSMRATSS